LNKKNKSFSQPVRQFQLNLVLAVELQPYGSKNLDGYSRVVAPAIQKTWDSADQKLTLISTECILHKTCISQRGAWHLLIKQIFNSNSVVLFTCKRPQSTANGLKVCSQNPLLDCVIKGRNSHCRITDQWSIGTVYR
jgi:hypothetical protein